MNWNKILLLCVFATVASSTLTPSDTKKKTSAQKQKHVDVIQRGLVVPNPHSKDILAEHKLYSKLMTKKVRGLALGYVTPWNDHGYNIAGIFAKKFSHICPVWLQLRRQGTLSYSITGTDSIREKADWLEELRSLKNVKIVPRVIFEFPTAKDYSALGDLKERQAVIKNLVNIAKLHHFDGLVVEVWTQLAANGLLKFATELILSLAQKMKSVGLDCILVIPPSRGSSSMFGKEQFDALADSVTAFSLNTYDFSSMERPGPNSPLPWARDCIQRLAPSSHDPRRPKILMGFNLYGNDFTPNGGEAIVNHQYLKRLKDYNARLKYDNRTEENYFETKSSDGRHFVFYPTLYSIHKRVELANEMNVGVAFWELGQGLDYFYDLI